MVRKRKGFTLIEIILVIAVIGMAIATVLLWQRVTKLNEWAVQEQDWSKQVYDWIKNSSFQQGTGTGGGNPDTIKPPPPPDVL